MWKKDRLSTRTRVLPLLGRRGGGSNTTAAAVRAARVGTRLANRMKNRIGSQTKTQTQRLNQVAKETRGGSESSYQLTVAPRGVGAPISKMNKNAYIVTINGVQQTTAGSQSLIDTGSIGDLASITNMFTQALTTQYGTATPKGYKTERLMFTKCFAEYAYTNSSNAVVRGYLYDIVPRQDIYNNSLDPISPTNAWVQGAQDSTGSASSGANVPGSLPWNSSKFTHFFHIKKITAVILAPGQTHYHRVTYRMNKIVSNEILAQSNINLIRGMSMSQMAVWYGQPVVDSTGLAVTTAALKVLSVSRFQYSYTYMSNNISTLTFSNGIIQTAGTNLEDVVTGATAAFATV